jgi:hypothetical protein
VSLSRKEIKKRWQLRNPEKYRAAERKRSARYRARHPNARLESQRAYLRRVKGTPEYRAACQRINRKKRYGVTEAMFQHMLVEQEGRCYICGRGEIREIGGVVVPLSVDHNHETGQVRRLLCHRCNLMIGQAEENPAILDKAAAYLRQFE